MKDPTNPRSSAVDLQVVLTRAFRALRTLPRTLRPAASLALLLLAVLFLALPGLPSHAAPITPALPHESASTTAQALAQSTPTPAGVPAGMVQMTPQDHPCWPILANQSACIQVDVANYSAPDIIPDPRSGQLNTSWQLYPHANDDIHMQVLSSYDLSNCYIYNPPAWMGSCSATHQGPPAMYSGWDAYLYLTVVDVMWQDVCWFCDTDGTQWHTNSGQQWSPTQGHPYSVPGDTLHHWVYDLNISSTSGSSENFPNGTWVMWNATNTYWNGSSSGGVLNAVHQCAPSCNGGVSAAPDMFYYFTKGFWYYDSAPLGTTPPYGPNNANMVSGGGPNAFAANLNLTYYPVVPAVGDHVIVDLRTQPIENYSLGSINTQATVIVVNAWYPNGTYWRSWASGFTPMAYPYNDTSHARVELPADFFAHSGTRVEWFIQAYDSYGHMIQSRNFTQIVSTIGDCPNANFTQCLNVTTDPNSIQTEGWNGWLNTTPPSIPGVGINQEVNVTILTFNRTISIQAAYIIIHVVYSTTGGGGAALYTMHRITLNEYYFDIPGLPEGSNVTFVIKAYDFNETSVVSHPYKFFIPYQVFPPSQYCFFYVYVFDAATGEPVDNAFVNITGLAGTIRILTRTTINGVAYPNVTGMQWTPRFLPANVSYTIDVEVKGFDGAGLNPPDMIPANLYCSHVMNSSAVLGEASNWRVNLKYSVLNFTLNAPPPPPVFSAAVTPGIDIGVAGGMIAATVVLIPIYLHWRRLRQVAEAEEKRITL